MMNVIKTAIITIIISIISGLLVEYFKNLAPRILCNIGSGMPVKMGDRRVYAYVITVSNLSKKIIHELSLNVQSSQSNLKIADAKITKGLKFESSLKDNILDIDIPFLSKGDEFSIKLYVENRKKPVIVMRSPENFKQIDSIEQQGFLPSLFSETKNTNKEVGKSVKKNERVVPSQNDDYTMIMNKPLKAQKTINKGILSVSKNKKILIATASVILLVLAGVLVKFYFTGATTKAQTQAVKTDTNKQATDAAKSSNETNKNSSVKTSTDERNQNTSSRQSSGGGNQNSSSKAPANETNQNTNTKTSTGAETGSSSKNTSQSGSNQDAKTSTDAANKTTDTKGATTNTTSGNSSSSAGGSNGNQSTSTQTNGTGENTGK